MSITIAARRWKVKTTLLVSISRNTIRTFALASGWVELALFAAWGRPAWAENRLTPAPPPPKVGQNFKNFIMGEVENFQFFALRTFFVKISQNQIIHRWFWGGGSPPKPSLFFWLSKPNNLFCLSLGWKMEHLGRRRTLSVWFFEVIDFWRTTYQVSTKSSCCMFVSIDIVDFDLCVT